jgi:SAM-dependent methyltransferase
MDTVGVGRKPGNAGGVQPESGADSFRRRGDLFAHANQRLPDARAAERDHLLARVAFGAARRVLDLQAASGYVAEGVLRRSGPGTRIVSVEPSPSLARTLAARHGPVRAGLAALPFAGGSFDVVLCLAGTHHSPDLGAIVREARRVLRPGGQLSMAEVELGSPVDRWLNGFVDRWSPDGHRGRFVRPGELGAALADSGFADAHEEPAQVPWRFADETSLVDFCRTLFGLARADRETVRAGLREHLPMRRSPAGIELGWSLRYAWGRLPPA